MFISNWHEKWTRKAKPVDACRPWPSDVILKFKKDRDKFLTNLTGNNSTKRNYFLLCHNRTLCISRCRNRGFRRQSLVTLQCSKAPISALQQFDPTPQHLSCNSVFWSTVFASERFRLLPLCLHLRSIPKLVFG